MERITPDIPKVKAQWNRRGSVYPDNMIVPMSDGSVVVYRREKKNESFEKALRNLDNLRLNHPIKHEGGEK